MRIVKRTFGFIILAASILCDPAHSFAAYSPATILSDSFQNVSQVDQSKTTANVDTTDHWVSLQNEPQANVIAAEADSNGNVTDIVVADQTGIHWFMRDQSTGQMIQNVALSKAASSTSYHGVALVTDWNGYYYMDNTGVRQVLFDGVGMIDNPAMALAFSNPVSLTAVSQDSFAIADSAGNVDVYAYDQATNSPEQDTLHSFRTGLTGIKSIQNIAGTWNFIVTTSDGAYQFDFDQATNSYFRNMAFQVSSSGAVAGAADGTGNMVTVLSPTQASTYLFDQSTGGMTSVGYMNVSETSTLLAASVPSDGTIVLATQDGKVRTYQYDQTTQSMVENTSMLISGMQFGATYQSPEIYQSVPVNSGQMNMFMLTSTEQDDPGTSISYDVSTDGGSSFLPITVRTWTHFPTGSVSPPAGANVASGPYVVQAKLSSSSSDATPRLTSVLLQGYLDVTPPIAPGQPTASPNPSGSTTTTITWAASSDPIQSPSTGASGVADYFIRFSTDNGQTWGQWIDTGSGQTSYQQTEPPNSVINEYVQVEAIDAAGNIGLPSATGDVFIDTKPLKEDSLQVTDVTAPGPKQVAALPTQPPVYVETGGGATVQIATEGAAQSVVMNVLGNISSSLYASNPVEMIPAQPPDQSDANTWTAQYLVPLTWADGTSIPSGTPLQVEFTITGLNGQVINQTVTLVITDGTVSNSSVAKVHLG